MALTFQAVIQVLDLDSFERRILDKYADSIRNELVRTTPGPDKKLWTTSDVPEGTLISNKSSYLPYVVRGTGLHGPHHDWIRPVKAKCLSWEENGERVFVARSSGMKPNPFVTSAIESGLKVVQ